MRVKTAPIIRFEQLCIPEPMSGCWLWLGALNHGGYAVFNPTSKQVRAGRWIYEQTVSAIPKGYQIDHICRLRCCVNPEHLQAVTPVENARRVLTHGHRNKTHCPAGHPYDASNTYFHKRVGGVRRICRKCHCITEIRRKKIKRGTWKA